MTRDEIAEHERAIINELANQEIEELIPNNIDDPEHHKISLGMNNPPKSMETDFKRNMAQSQVYIDQKVPNEFKAGTFKADLTKVIDEIYRLLVSKNEKYGNSALEPLRIFSNADSVEQIKVRIDDKLSRIKNQNIDEDEDVLEDLLGYLVLLKIAKGKPNVK